MTETIEQFAARVIDKYGHTGDSLAEILSAELPAFLAQHRQVVEEGDASSLADHLERWAERQAWWDERQYGTRMYYGDGANDYVQRGLLRDAISSLRARAVPAPDMLVYQEGFRHGKAWMSDPASRPALDVEAVAREIVPMFAWNSDVQGKYVAEIIEVLRRHATDTGTTNLTSASSSSVVTETAGGIQAIPVSTDTGWVQCPTTQTSTIKTPKEMGVPDDEPVSYLVGPEHGVRSRSMDHAEMWGQWHSDNVLRWMTWTGISDCRTPTTTRAWTAESVPEGHILAELPQESPDAPDGAVYCFHRMVRRVQVADQLNTLGAVRIYAVKPQDGPR
jgi:hypothetical protein